MSAKSMKRMTSSSLGLLEEAPTTGSTSAPSGSDAGGSGGVVRGGGVEESWANGVRGPAPLFAGPCSSAAACIATGSVRGGAPPNASLSIAGDVNGGGVGLAQSLASCTISSW